MPQLEANKLAGVIQQRPGSQQAATMTGAGGSPLRATFDTLSPPNGIPHLGKQQAMSSELRDNSLLQAGRAGPVAQGALLAG